MIDKNSKLIKSEERLFYNLIQVRKLTETLNLIEDGLTAIVENATRLHNDASVLFNNGCWTTGKFVLTTANEEMAKIYILLDMCRLDFTRHRSILKRLCKAFYNHNYKYSYISVMKDDSIAGMQNAKQIWDECLARYTPINDGLLSDLNLYCETFFIRELPLYIDFLDHDQRWSELKSDIADYTYACGLGLTDTESILIRSQKTKELGLNLTNILTILNGTYRTRYVTEQTSCETLESLTDSIVKQISQDNGIPLDKYYDSSIFEWPLYHFVT
jgi:AbiV family abortive infection protein